MIPRFVRVRPPTEAGPKPLSSLRPGESGVIVRVRSTTPERVVKLSSLGVIPGVRITLLQRTPAVVFRIAETSIALDGEVADDIVIEPAAARPGL